MSRTYADKLAALKAKRNYILMRTDWPRSRQNETTYLCGQTGRAQGKTKLHTYADKLAALKAKRNYILMRTSWPRSKEINVEQLCGQAGRAPRI